MAKVTARDGCTLHVKASGPEDGPVLVLSGSLGSSLEMWDPMLDFLPEGLRTIRYDLRGHGGSDTPDAPYTMGQLVSDAEAVCDAYKVRDVMFVGLSVGGMIAQGLAVKRPEIIRALVLSNTAAKIGNPKLWQDRIAAVESGQVAGIADEVMQRWFSRDFYGTPEMVRWQQMLEATPSQGYMGVCAAIAGTDFYTPTSGLRIPTLGIAGAEDKATPPDLVRETIDVIRGAQFRLMRRVGHLPCVEDPVGYAACLTQFMADTGHLEKRVD